MKVALVQQAIRTTTGTQDWTDASVTSDLVAAIFFGNEATSTSSVTPSAKFAFGCTDLTNNVLFSMGMSDGVTGALNHTLIDNTSCFGRCSSGGTQTVKAAYSSTLSNGVRINYTTVDGAAYLANCLLISGSDVQVATSNILFSNTDTSKTITHNLTGTPDILMIFTGGAIVAIPGGSAMESVIGLYDGTNSVGLGIGCQGSANPTNISARCTSDLGHGVANSTDFYTLSVSSVGSTTFTLNRTAAASQTMAVMVVAIRHTSNTMNAKAFRTTLPTSTGNQAIVSGMGGTPQVLFTFPTRLTSTSLVITPDDSAGSFGMGVIANNSGTTQQLSIANTMRNNVATSVSKSQTSNTLGLSTLDTSGNLVNTATWSSWNSGGVTLNNTGVGASAYEVIGLAFGITSPSTNAPRMLLLGVG